ncbi:hypothetical protein [Pseudomonas oryzihabitans]|uniref:hypothetical protein n=1 Tax=Pseudomonas oryzihabitans TaxID=47885 RepID=UPI001DD5A882|nr:hypothetical protein [Pseudomonas oryzihabitans]HJE67220.1 hypothetical protein [Pseudomonas oryzihabitans]
MVALISGGAAVTGLIVAAPVAIALGGVGIGGAIIYAGVRSLPPKLRTAAQTIGQKLPLEDLASLDHPPIRLAVVGATQSGKSTFLSTTKHSVKPTTRTNKVQAEIMMLPGNPPAYIALLDADGREFVQQFEILKEADIVVIFVDHHVGATVRDKSEERLAEHNRFIEQIEPVLKRIASPPKVHLLFNKRDLWETGPNSADLKQWFDGHVAAWQRINLTNDFSFGFHTNNSTDDTAEVMGIIRSFVASRTMP